MSILIKGTKIPQGCFSTDGICFAYDGVECHCRLVPDKIIHFSTRVKNERPSWCPLIELPPHGRLIDADALNELIDSGDDIDFSEVPETKYALMQMVNEQDTILEASPYRYEMIGKTDKSHGIYFIESEEEDAKRK